MADGLTTYDKALAEILARALPFGVERVALPSLVGRVLANPLAAGMDMPRFDNSAVDGFGVRVEDVSEASEEHPVRLKLLGTVQAGDSGNQPLTAGGALKILTGAPVPPSVDAVIMREFCTEQDGLVAIGRNAARGENIRRRGEEFASGQEILSAGVRITPSVVGLIATLGHAEAPVYKNPRVAVCSTGNELVEPGHDLLSGQIYDSNSYALASAVRALGIDECRRLHALDDEESTRQCLTAALESADVVLSAGGVSVGDYDFVKDVAEKLGIETIFWRIALKPGKPVYFGVAPRASGALPALVFGLPGNPVSALVTFHQLVKPAILKMTGLEGGRSLTLEAQLEGTLRKRADRLEFVRGILTTDGGIPKVRPASGQESHMMGGLANANCLIYFPLDSERCESGSRVLVEVLDWSDL